MEPVKHPYNPWYKATYPIHALGTKLQLRVPHDVFSTQRIDEGTLLLLENLATSEPKSILDVGCGYGALGLPLATKYPNTRVEMLDRDLLAVDWARQNAQNHQLNQVRAYGSLGFSSVPESSRYDWIVCNVPARIGRPFIRHLIEQGRARLNPQGDLRIVVIRDLGPIVTEVSSSESWPVVEVKRGPRHTIYAFSASLKNPEKVQSELLYARDQVELNGIAVSRPYDLGGDDPKRLTKGLPLLVDALPRDPNRKLAKVLCFRVGYGLLPILCCKKWPEAKVVAVERDLLATSFTWMNAKNAGVGDEQLEVRAQAHFPDAVHADEKFDLIVGELSPSAGEQVATSEIRSISAALSKGGQAYLLCLDKLEKDWVKPFAAKQKIPLTVVMKREGYTLIRLSKILLA